MGVTSLQRKDDFIGSLFLWQQNVVLLFF